MHTHCSTRAHTRTRSHAHARTHTHTHTQSRCIGKIRMLLVVEVEVRFISDRDFGKGPSSRLGRSCYCTPTPTRAMLRIPTITHFPPQLGLARRLTDARGRDRSASAPRSRWVSVPVAPSHSQHLALGAEACPALSRRARSQAVPDAPQSMRRCTDGRLWREEALLSEDNILGRAACPRILALKSSAWSKAEHFQAEVLGPAPARGLARLKCSD